MICPQCGTNNQDTNRYCTNCNYDFSANSGNQPNQQPNGWQANQGMGNNQPIYQNNQPVYQNNQPIYQNGTAPFHSHLAMSIVAIFFFTILGIIATVMSNQANNAYRVGDFVLAENKANTAKTLSIISYVVGSLVIIGKLAALAAY